MKGGGKIWVWVGLGAVLAGAGLWGGLQAYEEWQARYRKEEAARLSRILEGVWGLQVLHTAEGVYQFLFPYDFLPQVPAEFEQWVREAAQGRLSPERQALLRWARTLGYAPQQGRHRFVVLPVLAKAGLSLKPGDWSARLSEEPEGPVLEIDLPGPALTDWVLIDASPARRWGNASLSPSQWQELTRLLRPLMQARVESSELLSQARQGARSALERLLTAAGWNRLRLRFRDEAPFGSEPPGPAQDSGSGF